MKNKIILLAAVAAAVIGVAQTGRAVPIVGTIGFSGTAVLDSAQADTSTKITSWGNNAIGLHTGSFSGLGNAASVAFAAPWTFNSAVLPSFWTVTDGGNTYTFNLSSSSIFSTGVSGNVTSISVFLTGTVISSVLGLDPTSFTGSMTIHDPSSPLQTGFNYTESLSFNSVPDGGSTMLLLGGAMATVGFMRRKLIA